MPGMESILGGLGQIDPNKILSELDVPLDEINNILSGDLSYMVRSPLPVIDFNQIMTIHGKHFDIQFIKMFLNKAKNKVFMTEEESELYGDVLEDWFKMLFDKGKNFIWELEDSGLENAKSIMMEDGDDYYIVTSLSDENTFLLHYAGQIREQLQKSNYSILSD